MNETGKGKPVHAGARMTPYELVFTDGDFESNTFPRIREEAGSTDLADLRRDRFDFLSTAGEVVREMIPSEAGPDALDHFRSILFHAFHFWSEGKPLYVLEPSAARYLVESAPSLEGWELAAPERALYLQLPANLFWSSISPDVAPEPVDGFFVTRTYGDDPLGIPYERLDVLVVLGIRRSRAGFSVMSVESELGADIAPPWVGEGRQEGDFSNTLPGGELNGLYSILTIGEVLKLVARALWYVDSFPETLVEVAAPEARERDVDPPPTHLAHVRIGLGSGSG